SRWSRRAPTPVRNQRRFPDLQERESMTASILEPLPAPVEEKIEPYLEAGERPQVSVSTDMDADGQFRDGWLIATERRLLIVAAATAKSSRSLGRDTAPSGPPRLSRPRRSGGRGQVPSPGLDRRPPGRSPRADPSRLSPVARRSPRRAAAPAAAAAEQAAADLPALTVP